jgi:hypothetical protein
MTPKPNLPSCLTPQRRLRAKVPSKWQSGDIRISQQLWLAFLVPQGQDATGCPFLA